MIRNQACSWNQGKLLLNEQDSAEFVKSKSTDWKKRLEKTPTATCPPQAPAPAPAAAGTARTQSLTHRSRPRRPRSRSRAGTARAAARAAPSGSRCPWPRGRGARTALVNRACRRGPAPPPSPREYYKAAPPDDRQYVHTKHGDTGDEPLAEISRTSEIAESDETTFKITPFRNNAYLMWTQGERFVFNVNPRSGTVYLHNDQGWSTHVGRPTSTAASRSGPPPTVNSQAVSFCRFATPTPSTL